MKLALEKKRRARVRVRIRIRPVFRVRVRGTGRPIVSVCSDLSWPDAARTPEAQGASPVGLAHH